MAYRSTESPDLSKVEPAQLQALNEYWASLQPRAFTGSFDGQATLARDVVVHLTQAISVMLGHDRAGWSLQLGSGTAPLVSLKCSRPSLPLGFSTSRI